MLQTSQQAGYFCKQWDFDFLPRLLHSSDDPLDKSCQQKCLLPLWHGSGRTVVCWSCNPFPQHSPPPAGLPPQAYLEQLHVVLDTSPSCKILLVPSLHNPCSSLRSLPAGEATNPTELPGWGTRAASPFLEGQGLVLLLASTKISSGHLLPAQTPALPPSLPIYPTYSGTRE